MADEVTALSAEPVPLRQRQLVDWSAAVWAGVLAGAVLFLLDVLVLPLLIGGNGWVMVRLLASPVLGETILAPPATFDATALGVALLSHFALSIAFACLLAFIFHRGGLITGILGGALFGMALYGIQIYTMTFLFPWFFALHGWPFFTAHVVFGALAGGIYEGLEVEEFVPVAAEPEGA